MYLQKAMELFRLYRLAAEDEIMPCTREQVDALELSVGTPLPGAYKEFLLWMGRGAGSFLRGTSIFYGDLPTLRESALGLLEENHFPESLPQDAYVYYMHQGYQFMYFRLSNGDDPPIFYFGEGERQISFVRLYEHFSEFMLTEIEGYARALRRLK